jgi:diacylglycerol kinase family enzyme
VAAEFLAMEKQPVLGMIGAGSSNDIVRGIGSFCLDTLCQNIKYEKKRPMDMGEIEISGRPDKIYFLGTISLGLGVEVNRFITERRRRFPVLARGGDFVQFLTGLWGIKHSFSNKVVPRNIRIKVDNREREYEFSLIVIANSPFYANGLKLVPEATPFDGQLGCIILNSQNIWQILTIGSQVKKSRHIHNKRVTIVKGKTFKCQSDDKFNLQYDGELIFDVTDCRISVLSSAIQVLA